MKNSQTIWELLRDVYADANARGDSNTMRKLEFIHHIAKAMDKRLVKYAVTHSGIEAAHGDYGLTKP